MHLLRTLLLTVPLIGFSVAKCQKAAFHFNTVSGHMHGGITEPPHTEDGSICTLEAEARTELKKGENSLTYIDFQCEEGWGNATIYIDEERNAEFWIMYGPEGNQVEARLFGKNNGKYHDMYTFGGGRDGGDCAPGTENT